MSTIGKKFEESALLQTIRETEILNPGADEPPYADLFHVAFGVDENYAMSAGVAMTSLILHNPNCQFCFHLFVDSLKSEDHRRFQELSEKYRQVIRINFLDPKAFLALPTNGHITQATYYRLIIPLAIKDLAKRVLYLDSDITCLSSMEELLKYDFSGQCAAVISDIDAMVAKRAPKLKLSGGKYFNAGFLFINIEEWNRQNISIEALNLFAGPLGETAYLDQDALNIVLEGKADFLPRKWNYLYDVTFMNDELEYPIIFLHYVGRVKPWKVFCRHMTRKHYIESATQSPWAAVSIEDPNNYREAKIYSRVLFKEGDWLQGTRWLFTYAYGKLKKCWN